MTDYLDILNESEENLAWFDEHYKKIQENYEGKIVAIKDKRIVASDSTTEGLLQQLKEKGIDESEVLIEVVSPKHEISILWKG